MLPIQTLERLCMTAHQYRPVNYTKSVAESTAYCSHFAIRQQGHIMFLSVTELGRCRINLQMKVWAVNLLLLFKYWVQEPEHAQYDPSAHPPLIHIQIHSAGTPQSSSPSWTHKGLNWIHHWLNCSDEVLYQTPAFDAFLCHRPVDL